MIRRSKVIWSGIAGAVCLAAVWMWLGGPADSRPNPKATGVNEPDRSHTTIPPDPRLAENLPFRNIRPSVLYVGDARCEECHRETCHSYHAHPMGRSASLYDSRGAIEQFDVKAHNPWTIGPYEFRAELLTKGLQHRVTPANWPGEPLQDYKLNASIAIGSGTRGRSYLTEENGSIWQSPLSWFSSDARWDVSPGFDLGAGGRRAIVSDCLFCHVHSVEPLAGTVNRYREPLFPLQSAIGCERCHGPGELHVKERANAGLISAIDSSIVNPKHLSGPLQAAICEQCHLQGQKRILRRGREAFDFRPGLPFDDFVRVFVRHPDLADLQRSVGQFEQLRGSRCSTSTGDGLQCTHCHDPHKAPPESRRDDYYRERCQACHQDDSCRAPRPERDAKADRCTTCHMPRTGSSNIGHTSITNHRIAKRPIPARPSQSLPPGSVPLVPFHELANPSDPELQRDLGIALAQFSRGIRSGTDQRRLGLMALEHLDRNRTLTAGDPETWLARSIAHWAAGQDRERLNAARRAAELSQDSEAALVEVADAAMATGEAGPAEVAATKLIGWNPRSIDYLLARATARIVQKKWARAEDDARAALVIQPLHPTAHIVLAVVLRARGDDRGATAALEAAMHLATRPEQRMSFQEWYRRSSR